MQHFLEEDLYQPIHDFFVAEGYEVRSEVLHCDVLAVKNEQLVVVELKKHLSVDVLLQGVKRQKIADLVYLAVPKPKKMIFSAKWQDICGLFRRLELGLILVSLNGKNKSMEIIVHPEPFDIIRSKQLNKRKRSKLIEEFKGRKKDLNTGGSRGKKLVTAYRESSIYIACCLKIFGELSPKKIKALGTDAKKTGVILIDNYYGWFIRIEKGVYALSESGKIALETYSQLTEIYQTKITEEQAKLGLTC